MIRTKRINDKKELILLIAARIRFGNLSMINSTRICLPRMRVKAMAGAIATICEKLMISTDPGRGHVKSFAPTTSIKLTRNINSIPMTPTHSRERLKDLVNLSN
jgi:hypothetical protein